MITRREHNVKVAERSSKEIRMVGLEDKGYDAENLHKAAYDVIHKAAYDVKARIFYEESNQTLFANFIIIFK